VEAAALCPGVALIEGTNVSVGRGTDTPFQLIGAPWVDATELSRYLNARNIAGVRFVPTNFTPASGTYVRQQCSGVHIIVTDRESIDAPELGIELAAALHKLSPLGFDMDRMNQLLANKGVFAALKAGEDPRRIAEDWRDALEQFMQIRTKYLIY